MNTEVNEYLQLLHLRELLTVRPAECSTIACGRTNDMLVGCSLTTENGFTRDNACTHSGGSTDPKAIDAR